MENKLPNHIGESNEMVTAVEWLEAKLSTLDDWCFIEEWTIKAKQMEKEQIMDAFQEGKWDWHSKLNEGKESKDPADYYNQTYGK